MAAKFYQGTDTLTERSSMTVAGVHPGGLAVRADGVVTAASKAAQAVMVAQADSSDSYATWTDLTDSFPVGSEGTGIQWA